MATGAGDVPGCVANDCTDKIVGACETQLHKHAPGGQQSSCDGAAGAVGASWSAFVEPCVIDGMS